MHAGRLTDPLGPCCRWLPRGCAVSGAAPWCGVRETLGVSLHVAGSQRAPPARRKCHTSLVPFRVQSSALLGTWDVPTTTLGADVLGPQPAGGRGRLVPGLGWSESRGKAVCRQMRGWGHPRGRVTWLLVRPQTCQGSGPLSRAAHLLRGSLSEEGRLTQGGPQGMLCSMESSGPTVMDMGRPSSSRALGEKGGGSQVPTARPSSSPGALPPAAARSGCHVRRLGSCFVTHLAPGLVSLHVST